MEQNKHSMLKMLEMITAQAKEMSSLDKEHIKALDNILNSMTNKKILDIYIDNIKSTQNSHHTFNYEVWLIELNKIYSSLKARKASEIIHKNSVSIYKYPKYWKIYLKTEFDINYLISTIIESKALNLIVVKKENNKIKKTYVDINNKLINSILEELRGLDLNNISFLLTWEEVTKTLIKTDNYNKKSIIKEV